MARRDIGTDDTRVRVRPGRGSRPRTKQRPDYSQLPTGTITERDRGRFGIDMDDGAHVLAVKARELGRGALVIGDRVHVDGDVSGKPGSLARIAQVLPRKSVLRRSSEEGGPEKVLVANADVLMVAVATANPTPRLGMIDRLLVAAREAHMHPALCLTKCDLDPDTDFADMYRALGIPTLHTQITEESVEGLEALREFLAGKTTVLVGHSGVGKSSLFNLLAPDAQREVGHVNEVTGKGRHTSSSSAMFALPEGGYLVDTPGVRSFGLAHVEADELIDAFPEIREVTELCPKGCNHLTDTGCKLDQWVRDDTVSPSPLTPPQRAARVESLRKLLQGKAQDEYS